VFDTIIKRDGREVSFDSSKITEAIFKAAQAVGGEDRTKALELTLEVMKTLGEMFEGQSFSVEDVQDIVEKVLIEKGHARTAKTYILYRAERTRTREGKSELMDVVEEILKETNRDNANVSNSPSAKMLQIASAASKQFYLNRLIPQRFSLAHRNGDIHIHDLDFYKTTINCMQLPLGQILKEGFNNGHGYIRPPKRPGSATALTAIVVQSSQNDMFGGQSIPFFDSYMAPFVENSSEEEAFQAMEALVYNLNSMHSRAGSQVPFSSLNIGSDISEGARRATRNLLLAYDRGLGRGENPIFPNIVFRIKDGVSMKPGDPNFDLLQLAMRVAARRMNPTFSFMDTSFNKQYGDQVSYMGCRTRVMANVNGDAVTEKRGNLSFSTINLPRLAIRAKGQIGEFYRLLEDMFQLTVEQLHERYRIQCEIKVKDMPFVMGQGLYMGSENLKSCDLIEPAIKNGTLSIGFIGLAETLVALTGKHHGESLEAQSMGLSIVQYLARLTDEAAQAYQLNFTLLATPAEGLSGRFVEMDRSRFGNVPGVTDKEYYTNSFHIPVGYEIDSFTKIAREGAYHKYTNAGHISYVEMSAPPIDNLEAVESVIKHMATSDIGYAGINFPIDFCESCNYFGVIETAKCPHCGSDEIKRVRRITGYLSTVDRFNDAKQAELRDRTSHLR